MPAMGRSGLLQCPDGGAAPLCPVAARVGEAFGTALRGAGGHPLMRIGGDAGGTPGVFG
ncbi:hypothetical protein [Segniliparus rotundus]|uniref:hypothetical protein n=1 Tax=Segniliparus rotundus TaxID=286802 RepID=UPI0016512B17|nr:hypothetical protein [Segniliparus rotundus]